MTEEYEYVRVNMTPEEIAHAMIDGERFYTDNGCTSFYWNSYSGFINNNGGNITLRGSFYKRIKKERKFNEGEWYPCIDKDGDPCVCIYRQGDFYTSCAQTYSIAQPRSMKWIGESLGKIKFGE